MITAFILASQIGHILYASEFLLYISHDECTTLILRLHLIDMAGLIISSRLLGNDYAEKIKPGFE